VGKTGVERRKKGKKWGPLGYCERSRKMLHLDRVQEAKRGCVSEKGLRKMSEDQRKLIKGKAIKESSKKKPSKNSQISGREHARGSLWKHRGTKSPGGLEAG